MIKYWLEGTTRWQVERFVLALALLGSTLAVMWGGPLIFPQTWDGHNVAFLTGFGCFLFASWLEPRIQVLRRQRWLKRNADLFAAALKDAVESLIEASTLALRLPDGLLRDSLEDLDSKRRQRAGKEVGETFVRLKKQLKDEGGAQSVAQEFIRKANWEGRRPDIFIRPIEEQELAVSGLFNLYPRLRRWIAIYDSMVRVIPALAPLAEEEIERGDTSGKNVKELGSVVYSIGLCGLMIADVYSRILTDAAGGKRSAYRPF